MIGYDRREVPAYPATRKRREEEKGNTRQTCVIVKVMVILSVNDTSLHIFIYNNYFYSTSITSTLGNDG
jgi:hypothetical protein